MQDRTGDGAADAANRHAPLQARPPRPPLEQAQVRTLDYELFDRAVGAYDWDCLNAFRKEAKEQGCMDKKDRPNEARVSTRSRRNPNWWDSRSAFSPPYIFAPASNGATF